MEPKRVQSIFLASYSGKKGPDVACRKSVTRLGAADEGGKADYLFDCLALEPQCDKPFGNEVKANL
jgi:hypothetical protein